MGELRFRLSVRTGFSGAWLVNYLQQVASCYLLLFSRSLFVPLQVGHSSPADHSALFASPLLSRSSFAPSLRWVYLSAGKSALMETFIDAQLIRSLSFELRVVCFLSMKISFKRQRLQPRSVVFVTSSTRYPETCKLTYFNCEGGNLNSGAYLGSQVCVPRLTII